MGKILVKPTKLVGRVEVPPSKSISHRAIICGGLCDTFDKSIVKNVVISEDIEATIKAIRSLGVNIDIKKQEDSNRCKLVIQRQKKNVKMAKINCFESGSTLRFLIPVSTVFAENSEFEATGSLIERPLDIYYDIFEKQNIAYCCYYRKLPLFIDGKFKSGNYDIDGSISSQFVSGMLFMLPLLNGDSTINITNELESKAYVDLTIDILGRFGVTIENNNYEKFFIKGNQKYVATEYEVEGDYSQAAFYLVANELGSEIEVDGLNEASLQGDKQIIEIIQDLRKMNSGEYTLDVSQIPDLVPIVSVLASLKENVTTYITNARRLRIKESDRLHAICSQLQLLGADITELEEGLVIRGKRFLDGGQHVDSFNDHRIAMSLAIAATRCNSEIVINNFRTVNKSYPEFWDDYNMLGGEAYELDIW